MAVTPLPSVQAAGMWDACPHAVSSFPDRVQVAMPDMRNGGEITSLRADPSEPRRVAVSNGSQVVSTTDAGCTWSDPLPFSDITTTQWTVAGYEGAALRAHYVVQLVTVYLNGAYIWRTAGVDGGRTWQAELPPELWPLRCFEDAPCLMRFAPGLMTGYASSGGPGNTVPGVARTTDGGRTWELRKAPVAGAGGLLRDFAVDPADPDHLLGMAAGDLYESRDGAATWQRSAQPALLPPRTKVGFAPQAVAAYSDGAATGLLASADGGRTFTDTGVSAPSGYMLDLAVGHGPNGPALHLAVDGGVYRYDGSASLVRVTPPSVYLKFLAGSSGGMWAGGRTLAFLAPNAVSLAPPGRRYQRPPPLTGPRAGNVHSRAGGGELAAGPVVQVPPDSSAATVVTGRLARQPRGLDVMFLMDTSGSMTSKIAPMAASFAAVVDALNEQGVAARFGLAEYGDRSFRYRRHADLDASPAEVQDKMARLAATGGDEFHYTSFFQLATGAGLAPVVDGGVIPPGQQATFAPGSLRLVVHATDDIDQTDPSGPSEQVALAALRDVGALHVGIYPYDAGLTEDVAPSDHSLDGPMVALRRYAEATGAMAPQGGLDCDGNGDVDVNGGDPVACAIRGDTSANAPIADLLTRILLSFTDEQPVTLHVGATALGVEAAPLGDYGALDMHDQHGDLEFRLSVTCPADLRGSRVDVPLELHVGGVAVAQAVQPVECLAAPRPPVFAEPEARGALGRIVAVVPPAAEVPPALAQSAASAQATSSASSSAHASQVGLAAAPDDVVQVVTEEAGEDELRFVWRERSAPPVVPVALVLGVVVLGLAWRPRAVEQRSRR